MTAEMYHLFFSEYENDPDVFLPGQEYVHYEYSVEKVVKYIQKQKDLNRIPLAIMCDDEIAGEILIKNIEAKKSATMSIVLKNSKYKGHGIGTPHVCRHTYCSNMAKSGMNPKTLQYLMGHADISVTMNVYTQVKYEDAQREVTKLSVV